MPRSRCRGATAMPRAGSDTTRPAMLIAPSVGCSRPATQRSVVVLPQPEGPSSTTISPAATVKLTSSTAGRPVAKTLRRRSIRSSADISPPMPPLLAGILGLVPVRDPAVAQLVELLELREPDLRHLGVEAFRIGRRLLERGEVAELLDHEGLAFLGEAPVEEELRRVRVRRGLRDAGRVGDHR